ncbi:Fic family protein [Nocardioides sp. B-3]|uniref:Fic family protein n=1 Tax=Nocardioides sp. B-3 TaxID=2895565 RepID=UPI003FA57393
MQAAVVHAQFESIHPFTDGNGRIGRALINTVLRRRGATRRVVVPRRQRSLLAATATSTRSVPIATGTRVSSSACSRWVRGSPPGSRVSRPNGSR